MNPDKPGKRIVLIDDEPLILAGIRDQLSNLGNCEVLTFGDPQLALESIRSHTVNAIITDISMPGMSGLELLGAVSAIDPKIPVILITGFSDSEKMRSAIKGGAFDFLRKPFNMTELLITVKQALEKNELLIQNETYRVHLESLVEQRTLALFEANGKLENHYINTIHAMVNTIEANDIYTRGHSERVTALSLMLGRHMGLGSDELKLLRIGTLLHDLGKIGIYKPVLDKKSTLTDEEYEQVKQHPVIGARIIRPIGLPEAVHDIILQHHEWQDGSGYPNGLQGEMISPLARITAIADAYDAMTGQRPYRVNLDPRQATREIEDNLGVQFDTQVGSIFCANLKSMVDVLGDLPAMREQIYQTI